jgi:SLT domain-containing protein
VATLRYDVDVDTARAERRIGAFALDMRSRITKAIKSLPDIELPADASAAQREIAKIRADLVALGRQRVGIDIDAPAAEARLDSLRARLTALSGGVDMQVDVDAAAALTALGAVDKAADLVDGRTAKVDVKVGSGLTDAIVKVGGLTRGLSILSLPAAAVAITPMLASIGQAAVQASGGVWLLPAAAGAAGLAIGALKIGTMGFGDALKAIGKGDAEKFNEALAKLSPSARAAAVALRDLNDNGFKTLRLDVQERLFAGLAGRISALGDTYLPMLRSALGGVADSFAEAGGRLSRFLLQAETVSTLQVAFGQLQRAVSDVVSRSIEPLGRVFVDVLAVGAGVVGDLTKGIGDAAERFAEFIHTARQTGQLEGWIRTAVSTFGLLYKIVRDVGSALLSVFRAADTDGQTFLTTLSEATGKMAAFLKSAEGQQSITKLFEGISTVTGGVISALVEVAKVIGAAVMPMMDRLGAAFASLAQVGHPLLDALADMGPVLATVAEAITVLIEAAVPFAAAFGATLAAAIKAVTPALQIVAEIVIGLAPVLKVLAPVIGAVAAAFVVWKTAMAGIGAAQAGIATLGGKISGVALNAGVMTEKLTGSAAAGERMAGAGAKVSGALSKVGGALPIVGAALIGIGIGYDQIRSKADEFAGQVLDGSKTFQEAVNDERNQLEKLTLAHAPWLSASKEAEKVARADADARRNVTEKMTEQLAGMGPLERAQSLAALAQGRYNDACRDFGDQSPQAIQAAKDWAKATDEVETAQGDAAAATKTHTDKMVEQAERAAGFANADLGYQQSIIRIADAEKAAAAAVRDHGKASTEAKSAHLDVVQANVSAAQAAKTKAEADAKAAGITDTAAIGATAYRDTLYTLADQAAGKGDASTAGALRGYATTAGGANTAAVLGASNAGLFTGALDALAKNASGPTQTALATARDRINEVAGSSMTSEEKARLYKDELAKVAGVAALNGDTSAAGALKEMQTQLDVAATKTSNTGTVTGTFRTELLRNAEYQTGPLRDAYIETAGKLDVISGSNKTADEKTRLFKEEMQRLAEKSGGTLRPELDELSRRVTTLPDGTFKVTGIGVATWTDGAGTNWTINPDFARGGSGASRARGGTVPSSVLPGYTPGHDVHQFYSPSGGQLSLSGGEGILRPEATRALGGERGLREINRAARQGGTWGAARFMSGSFREGGVVRDGVQPFADIASNLHVTMKDGLAKTMGPAILQAIQSGGGAVLEWVRTQVGKPYQWGAVGPGGYDCSGLVSAAINVMQGRNPHSRLGSTGSMPWAGMRPGAAPSGGGISVGSVRSVAGGPGHMAATVNGINIESSGGVGVHMGAGALGANSGLFNEHYFMPGGTAGGAGSGAMEGPGGSITRWSGVVAQALSRLGQSQALVGITLRRMQQESGGNPSAINNWDANARRGTPSKGLMQVIDPTFAAYRDPGLVNNIWDPLANVTASMRYALARYGSLAAAYNRPGGYDLGGEADGAGIMRKSVLSPERVLSPGQTTAFNRLVAAATSPSGLGMDAGTVTIIANAAVRAALIQARADADAHPQTVVQWQAREPLGHADLSFVAAETNRLQSWQRRRSG